MIYFPNSSTIRDLLYLFLYENLRGAICLDICMMVQDIEME